jgi:hypothetical protein
LGLLVERITLDGRAGVHGLHRLRLDAVEFLAMLILDDLELVERVLGSDDCPGKVLLELIQRVLVVGLCLAKRLLESLLRLLHFLIGLDSNLLQGNDMLLSALAESSAKPFRLLSLLLRQSREGGRMIGLETLEGSGVIRVLAFVRLEVVDLESLKVRLKLDLPLG